MRNKLWRRATAAPTRRRLRRSSRRKTISTFTESYPLDFAVEDFCDGTRLAIILTMMDVLKVEELQKHIFGNPINQRQYIHNQQTIIKALHVRCPEMPLLLRSPVEWLRPPVPCPETLL